MKPKPALRLPTSAVLASRSEPAPAETLALSPKPGLGRILVPVDFSQCSLRALDYAVMLADAFEATVILLHVLEPASFGLDQLAIPTELEEQLQFHLRTGRDRLLEINRKRMGQRPRTETLVRIGRAWSEIPDTARALAVDLIVLGAHGETSLKHSLLGSTAEGVVRHANCPVLTVTGSAADKASKM